MSVLMDTVVDKLGINGVKASVRSFVWTKDTHGHLYERTGYVLEVATPAMKPLTFVNYSQATIDNKTVAKLAAFGLALASLGESE